MALAVAIRFDFVDDKGKKSFTKVRVPTGFTIADYIEFAEGAAQTFLNAITGAITGVSIVFYTDIDALGLKTIASSVSKVARKLYFQFSTAVTGFISKTLIPSLSETKVVSGSDDVDQTDAEIAALATALEDGIVVTGGTLTFTNNRGHDIVSLQTAKEQFRRRKAS